MVWRTNFDRHLDDFVLSHIERGETQLEHETDIFPRPPAACEQKDKDPQAESTAAASVPAVAAGGSQRTATAPRDGQSTWPSSGVRMPATAFSASRRCIRHSAVSSSGPMQSEAAVLRSQPGEHELEMPAPLALSELQPALANTLQHIVGKLDMMTQVIGMVEERLCLNEDKMANLEASLQQLAAKVAAPADSRAPPAATASSSPSDRTAPDKAS